MHLRYRIILPLVALCTALALPAFAAKPAPTVESTSPTTNPNPMQYGEIQTGGPACQLGIFGPAAGAFGYILPPGDEYYTYLDPSTTCSACLAGYRYTVAHVELYFTEPCSAPVFVGIVGADLTNPSCPTPNPFDVRCADVGYVVNDGGVLNQCVDYALPLGCDPLSCITGPVFLKFRFEQGSCVQGRPAFCTPSFCNNCRQYNIYPGSPPGGDDLCAVLSPFSIYGVIMYADLNSCCPVPTLPGSWGGLKTLYR